MVSRSRDLSRISTFANLHPRTIYHDTKAKVPFTPASSATPQFQPSPVVTPSAAQEGFVAHPPESTDYEAGLTVVGEFSTVEEFCRYFNWLKPPSNLDRNSNYHLFKSGIKPMWEDEANANGGKWVLTMKNNPALLDRCWNWLAMALVGEELEEGHDLICGAVVSLRSKVDRIQVWTRSKDDVEKLNGIGKKLVKLLDVSEADGIGLEFQVRASLLPFWCRLQILMRGISITPMTARCPTSSSRSRRCLSRLTAQRSSRRGARAAWADTGAQSLWVRVRHRTRQSSRACPPAQAPGARSEASGSGSAEPLHGGARNGHERPAGVCSQPYYSYVLRSKIMYKLQSQKCSSRGLFDPFFPRFSLSFQMVNLAR
jgi:hypothetical protein